VTDDRAYLEADAADRRAALHDAALITAARTDLSASLGTADHDWLRLAASGYRFLRSRDSLRPVSVQIVPGIPRKEGTPMTTTFNLDDTDEVTFSLTGQDAKGADVPLAAGFTAAWALADPDASGAVLTPSADTLTAVLAAGVPDTNLMVSVAVTNPDGSVLNGAEAVIVQATAATTVGLVAGTPVPEAPPA
jgi:hypothetical protein